MKLWTLDDIFRRWPGLWFRIIFEASLPTLAALIWGVTVYVKGKDIFGAISAAGVAFPIVLFAQGQLFRMAKNVRDEENANRWSESFASLKQAIDALKMQELSANLSARSIGIGEGASARSWGQLMFPTSGQAHVFFLEAGRAVDDGHFYSGALMAAVGFERAVRETARDVKLDSLMPLGKLIQEFSARLDGRFKEALQTVLRLRNSLVHATIEDNILYEDALVMIVRFVQGVDVIDMAAGHPARTKN